MPEWSEYKADLREAVKAIESTIAPLERAARDVARAAAKAPNLTVARDRDQFPIDSMPRLHREATNLAELANTLRDGAAVLDPDRSDRAD